jgi:hypothetical protein
MNNVLESCCTGFPALSITCHSRRLKEKMGEAVSADGVDYGKAYDSVDKDKAADSVDTDKAREALMK